ncbi:hypothetical protein DPMN_092514 [Dreissena polymorpha]|uniref:Uncharacterized protein n=1 Tax=Dreissena polymorpha TaxID=45954 RepID=A0A9D4R0Z1_DREPO|nr:hypothetical protein DPMN_092514 [Dreissena polymorpha]
MTTVSRCRLDICMMASLCLHSPNIKNWLLLLRFYTAIEQLKHSVYWTTKVYKSAIGESGMLRSVFAIAISSRITLLLQSSSAWSESE